MTAEQMKNWFEESPKTKEIYEKVIYWCINTLENIDLRNENIFFLFDVATRYLMRFKIGHWINEEALVVIHYLATKYSYSFQIDEIVQIQVLGEQEYREKHGTSQAICCNSENGFQIDYSSKILEQLCSNSYKDFLRGLQTVYHEPTHALQNIVMQGKSIFASELYTRKIYIMVLETITRKIDPKFYDANYFSLLKENHAEKCGLEEAMKAMKEYNPKLYEAYNQEKIQAKLEDYDKVSSGNVLMFGEEREKMKQLDTASCIYLEKHPEIVEKYPILKLAFHANGSKKSIIELVQERQLLLERNHKKEKIDELYETIANQKNFVAGGLKGTKDEIMALDRYIRKTGTNDEFVFDLLRFRLEKSNMSKEAIESFLKSERNVASQVKQSLVTNPAIL